MRPNFSSLKAFISRQKPITLIFVGDRHKTRHDLPSNESNGAMAAKHTSSASSPPGAPFCMRPREHLSDGPVEWSTRRPTSRSPRTCATVLDLTACIFSVFSIHSIHINDVERNQLSS